MRIKKMLGMVFAIAAVVTTMSISASALEYEYSSLPAPTRIMSARPTSWSSVWMAL